MPITHVAMDIRAQNSHFVKYLEHVIRGRRNHSEIDEGRLTDSKIVDQKRPDNELSKSRKIKSNRKIVRRGRFAAVFE
jgi:hypothetical protein